MCVLVSLRVNVSKCVRSCLCIWSKCVSVFGRGGAALCEEYMIPPRFTAFSKTPSLACLHQSAGLRVVVVGGVGGGYQAYKTHSVREAIEGQTY